MCRFSYSLLKWHIIPVQESEGLNYSSRSYAISLKSFKHSLIDGGSGENHECITVFLTTVKPANMIFLRAILDVDFFIFLFWYIHLPASVASEI